MTNRISRLAFLGVAMALLSAEAPPYDEAAFEPAFDARNHAAEDCYAIRTKLKDMRGMMNCVLAADAKFATAIKLRDRALFDTYAKQVRKLAVDRDAGRMSQEDMQNRFTIVANQYGHSIAKEFNAWRTAHHIPMAGPVITKAHK